MGLELTVSQMLHLLGTLVQHNFFLILSKRIFASQDHSKKLTVLSRQLNHIHLNKLLILQLLSMFVTNIFYKMSMNKGRLIFFYSSLLF